MLIRQFSSAARDAYRPEIPFQLAIGAHLYAPAGSTFLCRGAWAAVLRGLRSTELGYCGARIVRGVYITKHRRGRSAGFANGVRINFNVPRGLADVHD